MKAADCPTGGTVRDQAEAHRAAGPAQQQRLRRHDQCIRRMYLVLRTHCYASNVNSAVFIEERGSSIESGMWAYGP